MRPGKCIDIICKSINSNIELETYDGVNREGKISGLTTRKLIFNDEEVEIPIEIELNNDPTDRIPFHLIRIMEIY